MSDRILLGTRKGTLLLERRNTGWKSRLSGHAGVSISFAARDPRDGTLWASLDHGHWGPKMSRSRDGGETWKDAPPIKYPEGARYIVQDLPTDDAPPPPSGPKYRDATMLKVWVLAFGGADQPGVIHAGTIPGGLFTSDNGGETWELNRPLWNHPSRGGDLFAGEATSTNHWGGTPAAIAYGEFAPGIHSIVVDPRNSQRMHIAVSSAGVLETTDGGRTWQGRNKGLLNDYLPNGEAEWGHDPHFMTSCRDQPEVLWQQNHCGVFTSRDGGASWRRVSKTEVAVHFGFPIAVDERNGQRAWVVPGKADSERMAIDGSLFVARTEDGGETWEKHTRGLPQEAAYDVVYRHALDVSGDRLCFGSTTGNVYVSEDAGVTWQCVGNNLPPVHSVRFA